MNNVSQDGSYSSYGLMQVLNKYAGTFPLSRDSTAFNLDFFGASMRYVFDGKNKWLGSTAPADKPYVAGDIWGTIGSWFAGAWYNGDENVKGSGANWYIKYVKDQLAQRVWTLSSFTCSTCY
jgi:hypothetical protein